MSISGKHILLIVTGGIAAYKSLLLIREIQKAGATVQPILTRAATAFVTPLSVSALAGRAALTDLFDLTQEAEIGHIELSRSADLIVVAPASADFIAKMARGTADDLASTTVLATDTDILVAPAMNVRMWLARATQRNLETIRSDGVAVVGPDAGDMACGEYGPGRMSEPADILAAIEAYFGASHDRPLSGRHVIVTSGPTQEWLDPVRYLTNASSGKQGAAIAEALARLGARVSFVTGPAGHAAPKGCEVVSVVTGLEMRDAVMAALPADAAVFCAAVADWRAETKAAQKMKKDGSAAPPALKLVANPDILSEVGHLQRGVRPPLVVGFAAETEAVLEHAASKRIAKACDWILANDVSAGTGTFGGDSNRLFFLDSTVQEDWGVLSKRDAGHKLAQRIAAVFAAS